MIQYKQVKIVLKHALRAFACVTVVVALSRALSDALSTKIAVGSCFPDLVKSCGSNVHVERYDRWQVSKKFPWARCGDTGDIEVHQR